MKTVVGMFDDYAQAQKAVADLVSAGVKRDDISLVANNADGKLSKYSDTGAAHSAVKGAETGAVLGGLAGLALGIGALVIPGIGPVITAGAIAAALGSTATGAGVGAVAGGILGALVHLGVPESEVGHYAEGLRRGGALVTAKVDDGMAPQAEAILGRNGRVDVKQRAAMWQQNGWNGYDAKAQPLTDAQLAKERELTSKFQQGSVKMPVVEEQLHVGKEEVQKGGVRVTQSMTETPVEKDVTLRQEKVNVDRRPVDRPATDADLKAFQKGTIEVTETAEQAVVSKTAKVVEEVVVSKDVQQRTETVKDTVKRTDVNVEPVNQSANTGYAALEPVYRSDFQTRYGSGSRKYDYYAPAYRYGYDLANDKRYQNSDWATIEQSARPEWEKRGSGAWQDFKDSIRFAWDKARGKV